MHAEILVRRALIRWMLDTRYSDEHRFHLYVSSAPCGNACIRRWATVKKETLGEDVQIFGLKHERISLHAVKQGQIALTTKKEGDEASDEFLPSGVSKFHESGILSCSDKIAIFNAVGWTKLGLRSALPRVDLASITVGRKFARAHAQRALCCRLQDAKIDSLHHPALLCTAVKLDEGGREEDTVFSNDVFIWSSQREPEWLNYETGLTVEGQISIYSTGSLVDDAALLPRTFDEGGLRLMKEKARQYLAKYSI